MTQKIIFSILISLLIIFNSYISFAVTFTIETVEVADMQRNSLAFDSSGNPGIAYSIQSPPGNRVIKYIKHNGSSWDAAEVLDNANIADYVSLAFNSSNNPGVAYGGSEFYYKEWNGSSWTTHDLTSFGADGDGDAVSLVFDSNDRPAISFEVIPYDDINVARYNGATWTEEIVDTVWAGYNPPDGSQLAHYDNGLGAGKLGVAYYQWPGVGMGNLRFAEYNTAANPGAWTLQTVDQETSDGGWLGTYSSVAYDNFGNPFISYLGDDAGANNRYLKLAYWNGSSWSFSTVDSTIDWIGREGTSIAIDANGHVGISYYDYTNQDLKFALGEWNGLSYDWTIQIVDTDASMNSGFFSSSLDFSGDKIGIAYLFNDGVTTKLNYAYDSFGLQGLGGAVPAPEPLSIILLSSLLLGWLPFRKKDGS